MLHSKVEKLQEFLFSAIEEVRRVIAAIYLIFKMLNVIVIMVL